MSGVALTIYYSTDASEMTRIVESKCFSGEDSLMRADVLKDCLAELRAMYDDAARAFEQDVQETIDAKAAQKHDAFSDSARLAHAPGTATATSYSTPPKELCPDPEI